MRGRFRKTKRLFFFGAVRGLQAVVASLPRGTSLRLLAGIAGIVHWIDRPAIRRSLAHLEIAFGDELTSARRRQITRDMFRATGRNLTDLLRRPRHDGYPELVTFEGLEHLEEAVARGRGVVALGAHLGNWEVLGAALAGRGFPIHVVAQEIFDSRSHRLLNDWRRATGIRVHPKRGGLMAAARALRSGAVLGTLVDQDTGGPSVFVEFFGRLARTPRSPFALARRTGAALVPMWVRLDPHGIHRVTIEPALPEGPGVDREADLLADVRAWHRVLEAAIRTAPEQWVWHHRRWKSTPATEPIDLRAFADETAYLAPYPASRKVANAR